jgi:hypothetical protein
MKIAGIVLARDFKCILYAYRAYSQGLNRQAQIFRGAGGRCKVENIIDLPSFEGIANIPLLELETRFTGQMRQVFKGTCRKIVDSENRMAHPQESIRKVRAEKSGGSSN